MTKYNDLLGLKESKDNKNLLDLLKKAWEIRNFEIEFFWKRTTYFSAIVGAFLVAFFKIEQDNKYFIVFLGCVSSFVWFLSNLGSKFWQSNWERHIDLLEKETQSGDIYQVVLGDRFGAFSVSKLSMSFSVIAFISWCCLYCFAIAPIFTLEWWLKLFAPIATAGIIA